MISIARRPRGAPSMAERRARQVSDVSSSLSQDRVLRWPFYSGVIFVVFVSFVFSWPVAALAFSILFLAWAPLFVGAVTLLLGIAIWTAFRAARKRHWRSALSTLALPALLAASWPISNLTEPLVNEAHFLLFKAEYISSIARQNKTEGGQLMIFDWGGNAMVGFNRMLVFDESDEIILPPAQRSEAFTRKLQEHGFTGADRFRPVQTVAPHFNVVDCCW